MLSSLYCCRECVAIMALRDLRSYFKAGENNNARRSVPELVKTSDILNPVEASAIKMELKKTSELRKNTTLAFQIGSNERWVTTLSTTERMLPSNILARSTINICYYGLLSTIGNSRLSAKRKSINQLYFKNKVHPTY